LAGFFGGAQSKPHLPTERRARYPAREGWLSVQTVASHSITSFSMESCPKRQFKLAAPKGSGRNDDGALDLVLQRLRKMLSAAKLREFQFFRVGLYP